MTDTKPYPRFEDPLIKAAFDHFPDDVRPRLLALRQQIFTVAASLEGCGSLTESLKWRQPSYQTGQPKTGTPIRLGTPKSAEGHYALYVHCQTTLIETVHTIYPTGFQFEGTRALIMQKDRNYSEQMLDHVIAMALMYYRKGSRPG